MRRSLKKYSKSSHKLKKEKKIIILDRPSRISRNKIKINPLINSDNKYYYTRLNPPNSKEYFKSKNVDFDIKLKNNFPETCYKGNKGYSAPDIQNGCSTLKYNFDFKNHWGQRKLLLTEIDFLTLVLKSKFDSIDIIYAGAAAGTHIPLLFKFFPNIRFHLYDPAKFDIDKLKPYIVSGKITINDFYKNKNKNNQYGFFTDDVAEYYRKKFYKNEKKSKMLFISDIRLGTDHIEGESKTDYSWRFEEGVLINNKQHQDWLKIMKPEFSMLKFKQPYVKEDREKFYKYLKGEIRLQTWGPINSAETRLIIKNSDINKTLYYDIISYERKNAYYNYLRQQNLNNKLISIFPNSTLYDFSKNITKNVPYYNLDFYNEIMIYFRYLKKFENINELQENNALNLKNIIIHFMKDTTTFIYGNPNRFILKKHGD